MIWIMRLPPVFLALQQPIGKPPGVAVSLLHALVLGVSLSSVHVTPATTVLHGFIVELDSSEP